MRERRRRRTMRRTTRTSEKRVACKRSRGEGTRARVAGGRRVDERRAFERPPKWPREPGISDVSSRLFARRRAWFLDQKPGTRRVPFVTPFVARFRVEARRGGGVRAAVSERRKRRGVYFAARDFFARSVRDGHELDSRPYERRAFAFAFAFASVRGAHVQRARDVRHGLARPDAADGRRGGGGGVAFGVPKSRARARRAGTVSKRRVGSRRRRRRRTRTGDARDRLDTLRYAFDAHMFSRRTLRCARAGRKFGSSRGSGREDTRAEAGTGTAASSDSAREDVWEVTVPRRGRGAGRDARGGRWGAPHRGGASARLEQDRAWRRRGRRRGTRAVGTRTRGRQGNG